MSRLTEGDTFNEMRIQIERHVECCNLARRYSDNCLRANAKLPTPNGPAYIVMRIYWPEASALKGTWQPPAVQTAN